MLCLGFGFKVSVQALGFRVLCSGVSVFRESDCSAVLADYRSDFEMGHRTEYYVKFNELEPKLHQLDFPFQC